MSREKSRSPGPAEGTISIVGPGMTIVGDIETEGTVRIEGTVNGTIRAGKAVVVGRTGRVEGTIITQDAVLAGSIEGTVTAGSRLELQATCRMDGEILARLMHLEEGAVLNGSVQMGDAKARSQVEELLPGTHPADDSSLEGMVGRA